ncbi:MAG: hypothetical protein KA310_03555 [Pseudomonadales bacterium]|nr:hypothetical protein [Pseudomonadales bacterium]
MPETPAVPNPKPPMELFTPLLPGTDPFKLPEPGEALLTAADVRCVLAEDNEVAHVAIGKMLAYACGTCGTIFAINPKMGQTAPDARACAVRCCEVHVCACGTVVEVKHFTACNACRAEAADQKKAAQLALAKRVVSPPMLFCDCCDEFFGDEVELFESHHDDNRELPTYARPAYERRIKLDADDVTSEAIQNADFNSDSMYEPAAVKLLQVMLDAWCAAHPMVNFFPEFGEVVDLEAARAEFLADRNDEEDGPEA